jgi:hypothetical protein
MKGTCHIIILMSGTLFAFSASPAFALKDQSRLPGLDEDKPISNGLSTAPLSSPSDDQPILQIRPGTEETPTPSDDGNAEITPTITRVETIELTDDIAKRAVDGFVKLKETYQDTAIAEYDTLEDFVANAKEGPALESDIRSFGFKTVGEWNTAITSVSFAYAAIAGTQEDEIKQEIDNIKNEAELDEKVKKSLIEGLESMLPSENNKKIVAELNKDKAWAEKLKMLAEDDGGGDH